ncbi:unnamed protein product [Lymnaea stagnalis]|uniref:C2HC/C3H-type domain-containing protein n=1 Tax=Lymnaea stagnalis TaxID=6523 RepID=A0AAV2I6K3_LYMST
MRYREQTASHEAKDSSLIKCPYCDRQFNPTTAGTHIPWCKEYVKKYGIPMNFRSSKQGDYHESNDENFDYSTNLKKDTFSGTGRERATEYAKNIKKPSTSRKDTLENEKTGNDKKFPYTRPRMPSAFGVAGSKFASDPSGRDFGDMGYTPSPSDGPDKTRTTMRRSSVPGNFSNSKTTSGGKKPGSYRSDFKQKHS